MYPKELTGLFVGDLYIHEPGSAITNLLIALFALHFSRKLWRQRGRQARLWLCFIAGVGLAAFGGIFTHGVPLELGKTGFYWLWSVKNFCLLIANYAAAVALWRIARPRGSAVFLHVFLTLKLAVGAWLMMYSFKFTPVVFDIGFTYIAALLITYRSKVEYDDTALLFKAFTIAFLSGLLYLLPWHIHPTWLNNNDLVHIFALVIMRYIYLFAKSPYTEPAFSQEIFLPIEDQ